MNKNYRSIWNEALGAWVAVSEIENAKGKPAGSSVKSVKAAGGIAARAKLVLRVIPLMLGMAFGLNNYAYASSGATVTTTTTGAGATETTQAPIIIGTQWILSDVTAGTATLTGTTQSANLYYNQNPGNPYRGGLTSGTLLTPDNTFAGGVVIGNGASALNFGGLAIGGYASANQNYGIAVGAYSQVNQYGGIAIGAGSLAAGRNSMAMQRQAASAGDQSIAMGVVSYAKGHGSVAIGQSATAEGNMAVAIGSADIADWSGNDIYRDEDAPANTNPGTLTRAAGLKSVALGQGAKATAESSFAAGSSAAASGVSAIAIGKGAQATGAQSISIGVGNVVSGANSAAIGDPSYVSGSETYVLGNNNGTAANQINASHSSIVGNSNTVNITGNNANNVPFADTGNVHIQGNSNTVSRIHSVVMGSSNTANGTGIQSAVAIGRSNTVSGDDAIVIGSNSQATGNSSVVLGKAALANQTDGIAIGNTSKATGGQNATALGSYTTAGEWATSIGTRSYAVANQSTAFGTLAYAKAQRALSLGTYSYAGSTASTALGYESIVTDSAYSSTAIGAGSVVSGQYSGVWNASLNKNPTVLTSDDRSFVGGNNSYAIGNKNVIGSSSSDTFILGNNVKLGATAATLNSTNPGGTGNNISTRQESVSYAGTSNITGMVALGSDTSVTVSDGVALGRGSKAVTGSGVVGADPLSAVADKSGEAWTSTKGAVAVGDAAGKQTRQITGLAAGTADTDAVNVAQLKAAGFNLATSASEGEQVDNTAATADKKVQNGETVTVDAGKNIKLIQDENNITVATKENLEVTSVNAGGNILNGDQMNVGGQAYTNVAEAINALDSKIGGSAAHYYSVNDGGARVGNYDNDGATGVNAMAAGVAAQAVALNATAVGHLANAAADNATALGNEAMAMAKDTVAVGQSADATADSAVAVGKNAQGAGNFAVSIGLDSKATNDGAVAMGSGAVADNTYTVAIGNDAKALQDGATALGRLAKAESEKSLALGTESQVTSLKGIAIGVDAKALGGTTGTTKTGNIAIGNAAQTESNDSVVIGTNAQATVSAENAIVIGKNAAANNGGGNNSVAIGKDAVVTADGSIALGEEAKATAFTTATGVSVPAAGMITAIGYKASGSGMGSVVLGSNASTTQNAVYSVAIGNGAIAGSTDASGAALRGGRYGVAVGNSAKAIADNSAAFGPSAQAQNTGSLALGHSAIASVDSGVALGANSLADVAGGMVGADPLLAASDKNNSTWTSSALYGAVSVGSSAHGITRQITNLAAGTQDTDAVNVAQLKAAGFNLATSASSGEQVDNTAATEDKKVQNGETVTVDAGKNIKITQNANIISVATKDDVSFTTVTAQDAQGNKTVLNADGVTITPNGSKSPVSLTSSGLDNGGNVISNVANGSVAQGSTEAVTGDQLYDIQQQLSNSVGSVNQGLNFTGNSGNFNRKMGENTTIKGSLANSVAASSSNIRTVADSTGNIEIMLANAPTFTGKVTAQGLDAGGQKITNVQKGSDSADAVNVEQLQDALKNVAVATQNVINANSPFSYVNSQGEMLHRSVNPDGSVTFTKSADNTPYTGSDISIAALNAQAPQSTTPTTLGNIEAGTKANDAVNVSQLQNTVTALGGGAAINSDGTIKAPVYNITDTTGAVATVSSVGDALTALNTEVTKALTFSGDNSSVKVGRKLGEELAVKGGAAGNLTDGNIGVTGSTADNSLLIKLAEQINLGAAGSLQTGGTTVNNDGIKVEEAGKQTVSLTSDGLNNGGNAITNIAAGKAAGDAVNVSQLTPIAQALGVSVNSADGTVAAPSLVVTKADGSKYDGSTTIQGALDNIGTEIQKPINFAGNSGSVAKKLSETFTIKGGLADGASASSGNIRTKVDNSEMVIELAESPKFGGVTINDNGKITGIAAGDVVQDGQEAVNGGQLYAQGKGVETIIGGTTQYDPDTGTYTNADIGGTGQGSLNDAIAAVKATADKGWNLTAQGANSSNVGAGESVDLNNSDGNIVISKTAADDNVTFDLADAITVDSVTAGTGANRVVLDDAGVSVGGNTYISGNGINANNQKVTNVASGSVAAGSTDAVNGGQLYAQGKGVETIIGGTTQYDPDTGTYTNADIGGTGQGNLNDAIAAVKATADKGWNLTAQGANSSNVGAGESVDLNNSDGNIVISKTAADDNVTFDLADAITVDSVTAGTGANRVVLDDAGVSVGGNTYISGNGINANNQKVTNVASGSVAAGSTDAVNGGQLYAQGKGVETIIGGTTQYDPDTGTYTNADIGGTGQGNINDAIAAVKATADKGWNLTAQGANSSNVGAGESVDLNNSDGNIVISKTAADDNVTFDLADAITVDSVTAGTGANRVVLDDAGVSVGGNTYISGNGINANNQKVTNVASGSVAAGSTDAVNGGQLYAQGKGVETIIGGATQYDPDTGTYTNADIGGTGQGNLNDAIAAVKATADKGWNLTAQGANSSNVGAGESVDLNNSDGNIVISKTAADDNVTFDLADAITVDSVTAGNTVLNQDGVKVGNDVALASDGLTVGGLTVGSNGKISGLENGSVAAGSKEAVNGGQLHNTAASVANALGGGSTVNADGTVSAPAYTIIDPATGNSSVANNVGDALTKLNGAVNSPLTFAGDSGSNVERKLGTTVNLKGGATGDLTDNNIAVVADGTDTLNIKLAKELSGLGSIQTVDADGNSTTVNGKGITVTPADGSSPVSLTSDGINAGGKTVAGVGEGKADTDAVNVAQLKKAAAASANKVAAGDNIEVSEKQNTDGSTTYTVATAKNVNFDSVTAGGTVLNQDGVKVGNDVALASDGLKAGSLTVGTNGKISGLENGSVAAGSKEAVNGGQLHNTAASVANALGGGSTVNADGTVSAPAYTIIDPATGNSSVANNVGDALTKLNGAVNSPLTFAGDSGSNVERKLGTTVNLKGGATGSLTDNNIAVVADGTDTLSIKLAETVNLGSNGSVTTGQTVLNNDGVKVGDSVALTSDGLKAGDVNITSSGIDAGDKQISGVKAGEQDTDAVNVAQLKAAAAASANKVAAGDNIEVAETKNDDGSTTYTVATAKEVSFNSVTAGTGANRVVLDDAGVSVGGNTYISGNGINANNQKVTNVASGNVAAGSTDAVNGGQLHNTAASVANVFGGNATVNPDGSVSMSNIGGTGANNVNDAIAAVNQAAVEAKTTVSAGDNIVVAQSTNADGSTNYTVSTAKDLAVDSVKAGDTVLNGNGLSIANGPSITAGGLDMGGKKITNVADGEISATSKDAVNGSQLYQAYQVLGGNANAINTIAAPATENADGTTTPAGTVVTVVTNPDGTKTTTTETNQTVAVSTDKGGNQYTLTTYNVEGQNTYVTNDVIQAVGKMNEQGIKFFHTNDGVVEPVAQGHNTEDSSASGAYATAIGYQSVASGEGAVAMGNTYTASTQVDGAQVTEVKDAGGNVTGYAQSTVASGTRAIAMGTGSQALAEDSIAIGTGNVVTGKQSGAIGDPTVVTGDSAYSIGNNNTVSADNAYALGSNIKATLANSVYLGDNASATAVHTTAGGGNYTFAGANDANVAGVEDVVGVVSVGTEGETRQIQNVAAGVVSATSTDAINGSQLHYTNEAINSVANYTVNMGNQLNQRIDDVENRSNAGAATAMAVAGLPQAYMPGKSMVAVAGGVYRGESGYAVGYSSISDNGNWVIKGSATGNSRGHYGATAGVGYQW